MERELQRRFGRNLRSLRKRAGLTQQVLADKVGQHRTALGALERGERNATLQTIQRLANQLEIDAVDLLTASTP